LVLDIDADPTTADEARAWIAGVRQSLEEYRDEQRLEFIRARDRFNLAAAIAEVMAAVLLAIAIVRQAPQEQIVAALTFYLVGALAGLFKRLAAEANEIGAVQDYGFTAARIVHTPVLSGLAGLGGVMLIALLPALQPHLQPSSTPSPSPTAAVGAAATPGAVPTVTPTPTASPAAVASPPAGSTQASVQSPASAVAPPPAPLSDIFDLTRNTHFLILAAVFGLTPGLLTGRLQELGQQLQSNLQSSGRTGPR
jgi:hypothetical protein